jgi:hypothetical protein
MSLESGAEAVAMLPEMTLPAAAQKTGTDDMAINAADTIRDSDSCARGCAFLGRFGRNSSDKAGNETSRMTAGAESQKPLWHNEKPLQTKDLQGGENWHPQRDSNPCRQLEKLHSKPHNKLSAKELTKNAEKACARGCASPASQHETETRLDHDDADALAAHADPDVDADFARLSALWPKLSSTARAAIAGLAESLSVPTKPAKKR